MEVEVNLLGVLLAAVGAMIVGSVWYAKGVFGAEWMRLAKVSEKKAKEEGMQAMVVMFILALIAAYVLAHVTYLSDQFFTNTDYQMAAVQSGFWMWLGFVLYAQVSNAMFEQRPRKLMLLNAANSLVTFIVMGAVIGFVGL